VHKTHPWTRSGQTLIQEIQQQIMLLVG